MRRRVFRWQATRRTQQLVASARGVHACVRASARPGIERSIQLFNYPDVLASWRQPALELPLSAALEVGLERDVERVRFRSMVTTFNVALDVGLEDLSFESCFPADDATETVCRTVARAAESSDSRSS